MSTLPNLSAQAGQLVGPIAGDVSDAAGKLADKLRADLPVAALSALTLAENFLHQFATAETSKGAEQAMHYFNVFAGLFHGMAGSHPTAAPNILAAVAATMGRPAEGVAAVVAPAVTAAPLVAGETGTTS